MDTVEEKAVVALRPKPAFQALFQIATTREGSGVVLYNENAPDHFSSPEDGSPCFWWRRGRDELHLPVSVEAALRAWNAIPASCVIL